MLLTSGSHKFTVLYCFRILPLWDQFWFILLFTNPTFKVVSPGVHSLSISTVFFRSASVSLRFFWFEPCIMCYAWDNRILFYGCVQIPTWEQITRIHHSTNSKTGIQWCSLKYNHALKLHPDVRVHINYRLLFCDPKRTFWYL